MIFISTSPWVEFYVDQKSPDVVVEVGVLFNILGIPGFYICETS